MQAKIIHRLLQKSIFYVALFSSAHINAYALDAPINTDLDAKEQTPFISLQNTADDWLVLNNAAPRHDVNQIFNHWDTLLKAQPHNVNFLSNDFILSLSYGMMERALIRGRSLIEETKAPIKKRATKKQQITEDRKQIVATLEALKAIKDGKDSQTILSLLPQNKPKDIALSVSLIIRAHLAPSSDKALQEELKKELPTAVSQYLKLQQSYLEGDINKIQSILEKSPELYTLIEANDVHMIVKQLTDNNKADEAKKIQENWLKGGRDRVFFNVQYANNLEEYSSKEIIAQSLLILGRFYTAVLDQKSNIRNQIIFNMAHWLSDEPFIQYNRSTAFLVAGDLLNGQKSLKPLLNIPSLDGKAHFDYGLILQQKEQYEEAEKIYKKLTKKYPLQPEAWQALSDTYRAQFKFNDCATASDKAIELSKVNGEISPSALSSVFSRGVCNERAGHWDKAISDLKLAAQFSPDNPLILNYLAYSWADRGENLDEAEQLLIKAIDRFPDNGNILDSLGWVYFRKNQLDEAVEWLNRAASLEPGESEIFDHLGDALWYKNRKKEALYAWQRSVDVDKKSDAALRSSDKLISKKPVQIPGKPKIMLKNKTTLKQSS